jgi:hypothetical protein
VDGRVVRSRTRAARDQSLSPLPCGSLASLKSGMSGPCMACTGEGDEVSAVVIRFIEYGRPRSEDGHGRGALGGDVSAKARPTRPKINNAAVRIVWANKRGRGVYFAYSVTLESLSSMCGVQSCSKGHC